MLQGGVRTTGGRRAQVQFDYDACGTPSALLEASRGVVVPRLAVRYQHRRQSRPNGVGGLELARLQ